MSNSNRRNPPKRVRRVLSVTLHPKALAALDQRAADLEISRSRMIERLALAHCRDDWTGPEAVDVRISYTLGEGLKVHRPRKRPAI